jgi:competence protein ComEC
VVRPHQYVWIGSISFLLGVGLGSRFSLAPWLVLIVLGLMGVVYLLKPPISARVAGVVIFCCLVGWWRSESVILSRPDLSQFHNQTVAMVGSVVSDPEISENQQKLHLLITQINNQPVKIKVLLNSWHLPVFQYADQLSGRVKLSLPQDSEEFKYSNYLAKDNIFLVAQQAGDLAVTPSHRATILGTLYHIKHQLNFAIHRFLPEPHASLFAGLLLGIKSDLPSNFKTALKNSGTSHIVALSGFNVTIIISFLLVVLRRLPRRLIWLVSGVMILGFVIMTGAASSVIRAAIMGWLLLLASFWGRKRHAINAVLLAVATMVAFHPQILFYDVGFQLSMAATLGLVYVTPLLSWRAKYLPQEISEVLATTLGATLFTMPLVALYFGGVSWVTLGANLLVVPLVPYIMLVGCLGLLGFLLWPTLRWLVVFVWPLSALLFAVIDWFGNLPSAFVQLPPLPVWVPIVYYIMLGLFIIYVRHRQSCSPTLV